LAKDQKEFIRKIEQDQLKCGAIHPTLTLALSLKGEGIEQIVPATLTDRCDI